jgi:exopolysaccharide production protein ExoQ
MPPILALLLTFCLIAYLIHYDRKIFPRPTIAIWVPLLWVLIIGSRFVSEWLSGGALMKSGGGYEEGSPIDRAFFFGIIFLGTLIIISRKVKVGQVISENRGLALFLGFSLLSLLWSDFSFVGFKRWIKVLGHPILVLVLLTEPQPQESIKAFIRRAAYILIILSVTLIKYFPDLGRAFDGWSGAPLNTGVTLNKNLLGCLCMVVGLFFVWTILGRRKGSEQQGEKLTTGFIGLALTLLAACFWLMHMANSSTALVTLLVGIAVLVLLQSRSLQLHKRAIGVYLTIALILVGILYLTGVKEIVLEALGEDSTLTGRTEVWEDVLGLVDSPLLGSGFESFWLGPRIRVLWDKYWWQPNQAHNGYIEMYINLGIVGLVVFAITIYSTYRKARIAYAQSVPLASLWLTYALMILLYNFTEATFKAVHLLFFFFFLISMEYSYHAAPRSAQSPQTGEVGRTNARFANGNPGPRRLPAGKSPAGRFVKSA